MLSKAIKTLTEELKKNNISFLCDISAKRVTTANIGGNISLLTKPKTKEDIIKLLHILNKYKVKYLTLGGGSNLIIADSGIQKKVVIKLDGDFKKATKKGNNELEFGSAYPLMKASLLTTKDNLSGFEFAGGIPATIGGAVFMNAGAHGMETSFIFKEALCLTPNGDLISLKKKDLPFAYRKSGINKNYIILSATFKFKEAKGFSPLEKRREFLEYRKKIQPITLPSCGSIFKNPSKELTAGMLVEKLSLKGIKKGYAEISKLHGNWIVNPKKKALAKDFIDLIKTVEEKAKKCHNIYMEREVIIWNCNV